ncbi:MAG: hypothetical protein ABIR37_02835 [Candidatus Saccharimonadales bacterium]
MNDEKWWAYRQEMSDYMPMMIGFKRKRSGWKRTAENIVVWALIVTIVATELAFVVYSTMSWHWNPVLVLIGWIVVDFFLTNEMHKFVYADDSGLHNLPGYDPKTGTVKGLESRDTSKFWYDKPPSKRRR